MVRYEVVPLIWYDMKCLANISVEYCEFEVYAKLCPMIFSRLKLCDDGKKTLTFIFSYIACLLNNVINVSKVQDDL